MTARKRRPLETEEDFERVREQLDEMMLAMPAVAWLARERPMSAKYKAGLLRPVRKGRKNASAVPPGSVRRR